MSLRALTTLFAQKSWANAELFTAIAAISLPDHAQTVHNATRTLNHIYVVDRIFRAHLLGEKHPYTATNTPQTPELGELHFAVAETDQWFEAYLPTLTEQGLTQTIAFQFTDGDTGRMTREEMLFHVLSHGSYHRGNVGQMLKGIGVAPPRDLLTKFVHVREPARRQPEAG